MMDILNVRCSTALILTVRRSRARILTARRSMRRILTARRSMGRISKVQGLTMRILTAHLSQAQELDLTALASALGDASTKLPEGMERPATWPDRVLDFGERLDWLAKARAILANETVSRIAAAKAALL